MSQNRSAKQVLSGLLSRNLLRESTEEWLLEKLLNAAPGDIGASEATASLSQLTERSIPCDPVFVAYMQDTDSHGNYVSAPLSAGVRSDVLAFIEQQPMGQRGRYLFSAFEKGRKSNSLTYHEFIDLEKVRAK